VACSGKFGGRVTRILASIAVLTSVASIEMVAPKVAAAQNLQLALGTGTVARVQLRPGTTLTVQTNQPYADLVIGKTSVADVVPLSDRSFYIQGNGMGITNIALYGENKVLLGMLDVRVRQDYSDIDAAVKAAVPGSNIRVINRNDKIVLSGTVANASQQASALAAASQFAEKDGQVINSLGVTDNQQVALQVRVIEASRLAGRDLGIKVRAQGGTSLFGSGTGLSVNADATQPNGVGTFLGNSQEGTRLPNLNVPGAQRTCPSLGTTEPDDDKRRASKLHGRR
jgi:pilus assembly protein CpaC